MKVIAPYAVTAICDDEPGPGEPHRLRVTVSGQFSTGGCTATLTAREGNVGTGSVLKLDLNLTGPDGPSTQALTAFKATWPAEGVEPGGLDYSDVEFRVVGTDDEAPPLTHVEHVQ